MRGSPLAIGAAALDPETIATLKLEIAKPGMTADKLRRRLVPPASGATFWRALHGQKVSKPVQDTCVEYARSIRRDNTCACNECGFVWEQATIPTQCPNCGFKAYDFDPDPEAA